MQFLGGGDKAAKLTKLELRPESLAGHARKTSVKKPVLKPAWLPL
jgi:hypothetical protein